MEALKTKHRGPQTADVKVTATPPPSRSSSRPRCRKTRRSAPVERPPVPAWMLDTPMHSKIPLVDAPTGKIMLYTTALCEKLFATPTSLKFDPSPQGLDMKYRSLHDPHLRGYFTHPKMYSHLRKNGFLTPCGMVRCGLKQFNEYHQYVKQIHLEKLMQERRQMMKKTRSRDDRSSHARQHHKLIHKKRLTPAQTDSWQRAAYRPAKHRQRASSTKSISRPPKHEKKSEKIKSASKKKSISKTKTKTIRDGVMKAHRALEHRRKAGKRETGQRVVETQAHDRQFLQLKKRLDEEMEREKELERRKLIKKAKREMKLEEQWERRENAHDLQQAQEANQRHEEETKEEKVKVMRRRMAAAHRAKQQGSPLVFESIRDARAKLVAEKEAVIAKRLDKRLSKIREKYNRRHRRQMAIYRHTTKILNGKLQDHKEQLDARLTEEKKTPSNYHDVIDETANASTSGLLSLIHSTSRDSISSSNESFVFTPLVKEKPVISITEQVLSVTSLDYRQSPECRAEEQTEPVSMMQDVYLADESGEEEDHLKTQEGNREHLVAVGKGVAVKAWPERDHDGVGEDKSLHQSPEDTDERSSISTKSSTRGGSTSSGSVPEKLIQSTAGSDTDMEVPGSDDNENGKDAAEEEYSMTENDSSSDTDFWETESETSLDVESKPAVVEEDNAIGEELENETDQGNENTQQEQEEEKSEPSTSKNQAEVEEKLEIELEEHNSTAGEKQNEEANNVEEASKSQFVERRDLKLMDSQEEDDKETQNASSKVGLPDENAVSKAFNSTDHSMELRGSREMLTADGAPPEDAAQDSQAEAVNKTESPEEVTENQDMTGARSERWKDYGLELEQEKAYKTVAVIFEGSASEISSKDNDCCTEKVGSQVDTKMEGTDQEEHLEDKADFDLKDNQGEDTQTGINEEETVGKIETDSILLATVMDMFEEVDHEMHHHHNHEHHHHDHHHQDSLPEVEQDGDENDKNRTESACSSSSCCSSSSSCSESESEEECGDIIGVVENEIIAEETSVTSLKGCLSGEFVTDLKEVVRETENHRKVFEGAVMPARHNSATSSASSKVSINVTAAVLSADSLKVDSSGRLIHHDVDSQDNTKPEHKTSATNIPTDDKPLAAHDDEITAKETSHHHYSSIVPIYHNNLINVSEDLIDVNLSAISMKPDRHHKVPSSYATGSRNSFRNIFRPDMTFCQGSAKCLKDTLVRELSKHSKHSKHSSDKMDEYCDILDVDQEDVTAHHSEEELVAIDESEGVCYLPKRRVFKARHTITEPVSEQDEEVPNDVHIHGVSNAAVKERHVAECSDDTRKPSTLIANSQREPPCEQKPVMDANEIKGRLGDVDDDQAMNASVDEPHDQSEDNKQARQDETKVLDEGIASHQAGPLVVDDQREARTLENYRKRSHSEKGNIEDLPVLDEVKGGSIQIPAGVLTNGPCEVNSGEGVNIGEHANNGQQDITEDLAKSGEQTSTCSGEPTDRGGRANSGEPAGSREQIDGVTRANKEQTNDGQTVDTGELANISEPDNSLELVNKGEPTDTEEWAAIDEENSDSGELSLVEQANSWEWNSKEEANREEQANSKEPTNTGKQENSEEHALLDDDGEQANNREPTGSGEQTNEEQVENDNLNKGGEKAMKANSEEQANSEVEANPNVQNEDKNKNESHPTLDTLKEYLKDSTHIQDSKNDKAIQGLLMDIDDIHKGQVRPEREKSHGSSPASRLSFVSSSSISGGDDPVSPSTSFDDFGTQSPLPNCVPESFYIGTSDDSTLGAAATRTKVEDAAPVPDKELSHQDSIDREPGFDSPPLKESSNPSLGKSKSSSSHKSGSRLSAVIRKISSVLSVGRRRSSRVHPGDDTSVETKTDTNETSGATEQDQ